MTAPAEDRRAGLLYAKNVYVWQNGMVMTFDQHGHQMPDYQGRVDEVLEKVRWDFPEANVQSDCVWPTDAGRSALAASQSGER